MTATMEKRTFPKGTELETVVDRAIAKNFWYPIHTTQRDTAQYTVSFATGDEPVAQVLAYCLETGDVVLQCTGTAGFVANVMKQADAYLPQRQQEARRDAWRKTGIALALSGAVLLGARACTSASPEGNVHVYSIQQK